MDRLPSSPLTISYTYHSTVPEITKQLPCLLGVDEAGRGPVLGPMVYACCFIPKDNEKILKEIGVNDSKQLNDETRREMFRLINEKSESIGYSMRALTPQDISQWMLRKSKYNLNAIAHDTTIQLLTEVLQAGVRVEEVFIDTVGHVDSYKAKLQALFPQIANIVVAKKADSLYPVVSAASIVAKVTRDELLSEWQFSESISIEKNWGSGYPSDPNTVAWLSSNIDPIFGFPGVVRFSWMTCTTLLNDQAVKVTWPDEENELNGQTLTSMLNRSHTVQDKQVSQLYANLKMKHLEYNV